MWQDYVFAIGSLFFIAALIPMIRASEKPPLFSSIPTATVLAIFAVTYTTLDLWLAAITSIVSALCWFTLALQRAIRPRAGENLTATWRENEVHSGV